MKIVLEKQYCEHKPDLWENVKPNTREFPAKELGSSSFQVQRWTSILLQHNHWYLKLETPGAEFREGKQLHTECKYLFGMIIQVGAVFRKNVGGDCCLVTNNSLSKDYPYLDDNAKQITDTLGSNHVPYKV